MPAIDPLKDTSPEVRKCANEKAMSDLYISRELGYGCGHPTAFQKCGLSYTMGGGGENSCCTRTCSSLESCMRTFDGCMEQMWNEGINVMLQEVRELSFAAVYHTQTHTCSCLRKHI